MIIGQKRWQNRWFFDFIIQTFRFVRSCWAVLWARSFREGKVGIFLRKLHMIFGQKGDKIAWFLDFFQQKCWILRPCRALLLVVSVYPRTVCECQVSHTQGCLPNLRPISSSFSINWVIKILKNIVWNLKIFKKIVWNLKIVKKIVWNLKILKHFSKIYGPFHPF